MLSLIVALSLSQAGGDPMANYPPVTDEQKCQMACGQKMLECQQPCAPKGPDQANDEKFRKQFMACSKECIKKGKPCMAACKEKKDKGGKDKAK